MKQPKAIFLFAFTQVWASFSYYGMRALLVLYLINQLKYGEADAFAIYAVYTCLVEFGAILGGYLADRYIGLRGAVLVGGGFICFGHLLLAIADSGFLFFYGLSAIICGAMLFRGNLKALAGSLYTDDDPRREAGFTYFYVGINLGGFAAAILCSLAAHNYGWHAGFGLAAIGMLIGMAVFVLGYPLPKEKLSMGAILTIPLGLLASFLAAAIILHYEVMQLVLIPIGLGLFCMLLKIVSKKMKQEDALSLFGILGLLMVYFTFDELMGSLLMIFSENHIDRNVLGFEIPSAMLSAVNPLIVIGCGPLMALIKMKLTIRLGLAFFCLAAAFFLLYTAATLLQVMESFALIALGELLIAPAAYAFCSRISPDNQRGTMMGVVTLAFALANLFSGQVSQLAIHGGEGTVQSLFLGISAVSIVIFMSLMFVQKRLVA